MLSHAIKGLDAYLATASPGAKQVACIDVVVPTYRCNVEQLRRLCSLECLQPASVHTILVVDQPTVSNLKEVRGLASYTANRIVRVHVQEANGGASFARNTGLAQSFGDYVVLLDDDVQPEPGLLDAYLGAIARHPGEAAYIGLTELPRPETWVQCALKACRICYFYGIAALRQNPPWGVTANMCVRGRTISSSFEPFSSAYPRTGGGEDVDFCIRSQGAGHGKLVAVPAAKVLHPYWDAPFKQIAGWASGDVLCLSRLPQVTFRAPPNWAETALLCVLWEIAQLLLADGCFEAAPTSLGYVGPRWLLGCCSTLGTVLWTVLSCVSLAAVIEVAMLFPRFYMFAEGLPKSRVFVALLATAPPMLQDLVRLHSKLRRGRLTELCLHFDWMNATGQHPAEISSNLCWKLAAWSVTLWAFQQPESRERAITLLVILYTGWVLRHCGTLMLGDWKRAIVRRPLDVDFEPGRVPFVVLAYQRTGTIPYLKP